MVSTILTLTDILLGLTGAVLGSFPSTFEKSIGRLGTDAQTRRLWGRLTNAGELTDNKDVQRLISGLGIEDPQVFRLKVETGMNFAQPRTLTRWVSQWDSGDKVLPNILDMDAVDTEIEHDETSRRNRWAFGMIAIAYAIQVLALFVP
jgi:hypothetical protein